MEEHTSLSDARSARSEDLSPEVLSSFVTELSKTTFKAPKSLSGKIRMRLKDLLQEIASKATHEHRKERLYHAAQRVFSGLTERNFREGETRQLMELMQHDRLSIIRVNNKPVAICGWEDFGETAEGRPVVMIAKWITLPGYKGQGFKALLSVLKTLRSDSRKPLIVAWSRNPEVKKMLAKRMREVDLHDLLGFRKRSGRSSEAQNVIAMSFFEEQGGWGAYVMDLFDTQSEDKTS